MNAPYLTIFVVARTKKPSPSLLTAIAVTQANLAGCWAKNLAGLYVRRSLPNRPQEAVFIELAIQEEDALETAHLDLHIRKIATREQSPNARFHFNAKALGKTSKNIALEIRTIQDVSGTSQLAFDILKKKK